MLLSSVINYLLPMIVKTKQWMARSRRIVSDFSVMHNKQNLHYKTSIDQTGVSLKEKMLSKINK